MRSALKTSVMTLGLLLMLIVTAQASGPCPDDPDLFKDCDPDAPPFYVVVNRSFESLDRAGTGCQPLILGHPECTDCCGEDEACTSAEAGLVENVCPLLAAKIDWAHDGQTEIVYQMCCDCVEGEEGSWKYRVRLLYPDGSCPIDPDNPGCYQGTPPGTGIDQPTPIIVGGLSLIGTALLLAGLVVRRRSRQTAS